MEYREIAWGLMSCHLPHLAKHRPNRIYSAFRAKSYVPRQALQPEVSGSGYWQRCSVLVLSIQAVFRKDALGGGGRQRAVGLGIIVLVIQISFSHGN